jgi:hypothetical protein
VVLDLYVLKRDGCVFDLTYAAPSARYPAGLADFGCFVAGFADHTRAARLARLPGGSENIP